MITKRIKHFVKISGCVVLISPLIASAAMINIGYSGTLTQLIADITVQVVRIGAALLTIMIVWTGFLFVTSQGVPGEIEKAKKSLWYVVIGGGILLGATALAAVISGTFGSIF
jgi:hypothetical protein